MKSFEQKLNCAIEICEGKCPETIFDRVYSFATENVSDYLKYFDLKNKSLLTIGSSGDQVLNAYYNGGRDITLIDINQFSKFYLYLKISAILSLSYEEFKLFFFVHGTKEYYNKKLFSKELFNKIKSTLRLLDYESYLFFDELFSRFDSQIIKSNLINFDEVRNKVICGFNNYLKNENAYNTLKKEIHSITFKFINEDIFESNLDRQYDNIILSNLSGYCDLNKFKMLLNRLSTTNLNEEGKMLIAYLWDISYDSEVYNEDWLPIYNLPLVKEQFKDYITEHHQVNGARSMIWWQEKQKDLVLIYKKH